VQGRPQKVGDVQVLMISHGSALDAAEALRAPALEVIGVDAAEDAPLGIHRHFEPPDWSRSAR
jgi:hypothetical protein